MMRINIKGTEVVITPEIRSYFDKCMAKVEKLIAKDPTALVDVELERITSHNAKEVFRVDVTITGAGMQVRAEAKEGSLHAAIDIVEERLTSELRKIKGKRLDVVRKQAARLKNIFKGFRE